MSFDAAYQYWQVRTGEVTDLHPPIMVWLWAVADRVIAGPGGLLVFEILLFYGALAWFMAQVTRPWRVRALILFLIGSWPPVVLMLMHVWKDVLMTGFLVLAAAAGWASARWKRPGICALALVCAAMATALRHNGLLAGVPLAWLALAPWTPRLRARAATVLLFAAVALLLSSLQSAVPGVKHRTVWPTVALWDLAAISVSADRMLMPDFTIGPTMTIDELEQAVEPWSNTPLFQRTTSGVRSGLIEPYSPEQEAELAAAWRHAVRQYPGAYLQHRARLAAELFGFVDAPKPVEIYYVPRIVQYRDNPAIDPRWHAWKRAAIQGLAGLRSTFLFDGWIYLAASVWLLASAGRRRGRLTSAALAASGLLTALPLVFIAPSAEFRYLLWTVVATLLAGAARMAETRFRQPCES